MLKGQLSASEVRARSTHICDMAWYVERRCIAMGMSKVGPCDKMLPQTFEKKSPSSNL